MLAVPIYNVSGEQTGEAEIDPAVLGGRVRLALMKQAIVAYRDRQRQQSARTKGRSQVVGSTRKLYRQKGTGNARVGNIRTCVRRGGGRAFARREARSSVDLPKKMRRLACNSAILAKIRANDVLILDGLTCSEPKTKVLSSVLSALGVERGCLLTTHELDRNVYLSGRNIPNSDVRILDDLNAHDVLRRRKLIFTKPAFERLGEAK